jgi:cell division protein FtsI/penicillin-binding protein 2
MSSFGEGITVTPLQLTAMLGAIANGGTLYYLQYPGSPEEAGRFVPRVKRQLDVGLWLEEVKPGMLGAVEFGTGRNAAYSPNEPILGKTGTCTDSLTPTHLGWFGSFNETGNNNVVVVVLLTGAGRVSGSVASTVAGKIYRRLSEQQYFARERVLSPAVLLAEDRCCVR